MGRMRSQALRSGDSDSDMQTLDRRQQDAPDVKIRSIGHYMLALRKLKCERSRYNSAIHRISIALESALKGYGLPFVHK